MALQPSKAQHSEEVTSGLLILLTLLLPRLNTETGKNTRIGGRSRHTAQKTNAGTVQLAVRNALVLY